MDQNIISYLESNKDKYSQESLVEQLKKAGYAENDIRDGVQSVYVSRILPGDSGVVSGGNFWDFKSKKSYVNSSEKWKDFLFGFFAPWLLGTLSFVVPFFSFIVLICAILTIVYLFNRRRFIAYGVLVNIIALPAIGIFMGLIFAGFYM